MDPALIIAVSDKNVYQVAYSVSSGPGATPVYISREECAPMLQEMRSYAEPCTVSRDKNFAIADDNSSACKNVLSMMLKLHRINQQNMYDQLKDHNQSCDMYSCKIASLLCNNSWSMGPEAANYAYPIAFGYCN